MAADIVAQALAGNIELTKNFGSAFETGMKIAQAAQNAKLNNSIQQQKLEISRAQNDAKSKQWAVDAIRTGIKDVPETKRKMYFEQIQPQLEQFMGQRFGPGFSSAMGINPETMSTALDEITKLTEAAGGDYTVLMKRYPEMVDLFQKASGADNPKDAISSANALIAAASRTRQGIGIDKTMQGQQFDLYRDAMKEADRLGVQVPKSLLTPPVAAGLSKEQMSDLSSLRDAINSAKQLEITKPRIESALDASERVKASEVQKSFLKGYLDGSIPRTPETTGRVNKIAADIIAADKRQEFVVSERDKTLARSDVVYNNISKINDKFADSKGQLDSLSGLLESAKAGNAVAGNMLYGPLQSLIERRDSVVRDPELERVMNSQGIISSISQILPKLATGAPASPEVLAQVEEIKNTLSKAMSRGYTSLVKPILIRAKKSGISEKTLISEDMKDLYQSGETIIKKSKEPQLIPKIEAGIISLVSKAKSKEEKKKLLDQYNRETKGVKISPLKMKELIGE